MQTITLYHDDYETRNGDGFYPSIFNYPGFVSIDIGFQIVNGQLLQMTGPVIRGYDGDTYNKIVGAVNAVQHLVDTCF